MFVLHGEQPANRVRLLIGIDYIVVNWAKQKKVLEAMALVVSLARVEARASRACRTYVADASGDLALMHERLAALWKSTAISGHGKEPLDSCGRRRRRHAVLRRLT